MGLAFSNIIIYYIQYRNDFINDKEKNKERNRESNIINIPDIYRPKQVELKTRIPNSVT